MSILKLKPTVAICAILLSILIANSAWSQSSEVGNGGDAVVCFDTHNHAMEINKILRNSATDSEVLAHYKDIVAKLEKFISDGIHISDGIQSHSQAEGVKEAYYAAPTERIAKLFDPPLGKRLAFSCSIDAYFDDHEKRMCHVDIDKAKAVASRIREEITRISRNVIDPFDTTEKRGWVQSVKSMDLEIIKYKYGHTFLTNLSETKPPSWHWSRFLNEKVLPKLKSHLTKLESKNSFYKELHSAINSYPLPSRNSAGQVSWEPVKWVVEISDEGRERVSIPGNCLIMQIARRFNDIIEYHNFLVGKLAVLDTMALIYHEGAFSMLKQEDPSATARNIHKLVGFMLAQNTQGWSTNQHFEFLSKLDHIGKYASREFDVFGKKIHLEDLVWDSQIVMGNTLKKYIISVPGQNKPWPIDGPVSLSRKDFHLRTAELSAQTTVYDSKLFPQGCTAYGRLSIDNANRLNMVSFKDKCKMTYFEGSESEISVLAKTLDGDTISLYEPTDFNFPNLTLDKVIKLKFDSDRKIVSYACFEEDSVSEYAGIKFFGKGCFRDYFDVDNDKKVNVVAFFGFSTFVINGVSCQTPKRLEFQNGILQTKDCVPLNEDISVYGYDIDKVNAVFIDNNSIVGVSIAFSSEIKLAEGKKYHFYRGFIGFDSGKKIRVGTIESFDDIDGRRIQVSEHPTYFYPNGSIFRTHIWNKWRVTLPNGDNVSVTGWVVFDQSGRLRMIQSQAYGNLVITELYDKEKHPEKTLDFPLGTNHLDYEVPSYAILSPEGNVESFRIYSRNPFPNRDGTYGGYREKPMAWIIYSEQGNTIAEPDYTLEDNGVSYSEVLFDLGRVSEIKDVLHLWADIEHRTFLIQRSERTSRVLFHPNGIFMSTNATVVMSGSGNNMIWFLPDSEATRFEISSDGLILSSTIRNSYVKNLFHKKKSDKIQVTSYYSESPEGFTGTVFEDKVLTKDFLTKRFRKAKKVKEYHFSAGDQIACYYDLGCELAEY
jgi:hypothetical protein